MLKQRHQVFVTLFAGADALAITGACVGALAMRTHWFGEPWPTDPAGWLRASLATIAVPVALLTLAACRLYRPRRDRSLIGEQWMVLRAGLLSVATVVVALWAIGSDRLLPINGHAAVPLPSVFGLPVTDPARFQLGILAVLIPGFVGAHRLVLRCVLRELRRRGKNMRHVAIVGTGRLAQITARTLTRNSWTGIRVAYFISHHPTTQRATCMGSPVRAGLDQLDRTLDRHPVDAVYVALPGSAASGVAPLLRRLERHAVDVRIVPDVHPRFLPQNMAVSELEGMPILSYRESPLAGFGGVLKRAMDIAGAALALIVFAPVMLVIAALVRLSGPGPIIFRQTRVSLGGEAFQIYKFRTMRHAEDESGLLSDAEPGWTTRDDPRVTRIGRWLRRASLDELPQLFNVLRGDMALVGPRPERPELIDRFRDDWRGYMLRQHVKAGITGWAQVNGYRGDTSLRKRLQYDLFYIRNWSIAFDLRILALTVTRGFIHRNAM
ncbi:MAG: undecaprenyl-phosphate glucose phosphotransferase [Phycisphaerales bacterium]|nr:undecaprenyl-phosphate glucose phosphotransferase [Planctomycetota bacterium]MCH8507237.1 undecaprenyl-phosphate glucose phosphotransferase [Phycisphaerales bacterium]